jgi:two-component system sensor histidine kinase AlgZ
MHPFIANPSWLLIYLAAWVPLSVIVAVTLVARGEVTVAQSIALAAPMGIIYALLGIPVYYVCRANPIRGARWPRALISHFVGAGVFGLIWWIIARSILSSLARAGDEWMIASQSVWGLMPALVALGGLFYLLVVAGYYMILSAAFSRQAEQHQARLAVQAKGAELRALKAQVNPHFLFNSLHSISSLTITDGPKAREACIRLADFLRQTIGLGEQRLVPLTKEIELTHNYLEVERIRLGERLTYIETIAENVQSFRVPPLVIQPLIENAILHGISTLSEGGELRVDIMRDESKMHIVVENPFDPNAPLRPGAGTGQANLRMRLDGQFGSEAVLHTMKQNDVYRAEISLPLIAGGVE